MASEARLRPPQGRGFSTFNHQVPTYQDILAGLSSARPGASEREHEAAVLAEIAPLCKAGRALVAQLERAFADVNLVDKGEPYVPK